MLRRPVPRLSVEDRLMVLGSCGGALGSATGAISPQVLHVLRLCLCQ